MWTLRRTFTSTPKTKTSPEFVGAMETRNQATLRVRPTQRAIGGRSTGTEVRCQARHALGCSVVQMRSIVFAMRRCFCACPVALTSLLGATGWATHSRRKGTLATPCAPLVLGRGRTSTRGARAGSGSTRRAATPPVSHVHGGDGLLLARPRPVTRRWYSVGRM